MDQYANSTLFSVINAGKSLEQDLSKALGRIGLSMAKYGALCVLAASAEPLPLSVCARRMTCVRSNITQLMDRLAADGLIEREADPTDRRSVKAKLTAKGAELQLAGDQICSDIENDLAGLFSDQQAKTLRAALQQIS